MPHSSTMRKAEALLERGMQLGLDAGADAEADLVTPFVLAGRQLEQHGRDDAEIVDDGGARLGHLAPPVLRMEAVGLDLAVARQDGAHQGNDAGVGMIERQGIVDAILAPGAGRPRRRARRTRRRTPPRSRATARSPWAGRSCPMCRGCWPASRARDGSRAPGAMTAPGQRRRSPTRSRAAGGRSRPAPPRSTPVACPASGRGRARCGRPDRQSPRRGSPD